ncbi:hypothetical protein SAMN05216266_104171 [Amycolatopsis marina]|uniref:Uncharacterized protein n=1 Tax=Amycolatopsis marina TaxID=490629 RepID=A0A1I0Y1B2_9PSEU|nr:hypothetical protein SAMN05216266_104171 [Amycolatopsis marina]
MSMGQKHCLSLNRGTCDTVHVSDEPVSTAEITRALRSVRPASYRIEAAPNGPALALVMNASPSGRRNAADRIVRLLGEHGLGLDVPDPVDALTAETVSFAVVRLP